jgi:hypothetical protein
MVTFDDADEAKEFVSAFTKLFRSRVVERDDKKQGSDKEYGYYGAYHIGCLVDGLTTEIQVMTKRLRKYKSVAHKIYSDTREKGANEYDKIKSRYLFRIGNEKMPASQETVRQA